ncbi:MAG: hypothetical protein JOY79_06460, partial [Acidobacteriaceae bacterium]|nr:hypothetical protein [Acidobacteriaceae bacterium]
MLTPFEAIRFPIRVAVVMMLVFVLLPACAAAQSEHNSGYDHGIPSNPAEQEAERDVSLPADKIVEILKREPALVLEVKRQLVKEAYDQGRILASDDLTDEALFKLVKADANIRAIATREIVDRGYIRLRPTRQEQASRGGEARRDTAAPPVPEVSQPDGGASGPAQRHPMLKADAEAPDSTEPNGRMPQISPDQLPALMAAAKAKGISPNDASPDQLRSA